MNGNPYINQMKLEKRSYDKRSEYSLLLFIFLILPLATYSLDDGGWHIKTIKQQLHDFGETGTPLFHMFSIAVIIVGLYSFWKAKKITSKIHREEWREWEAKNRTES